MLPLTDERRRARLDLSRAQPDRCNGVTLAADHVIVLATPR